MIDTQKVLIRSVRLEDYPAIKELCDQRFGTGYLDRDTFTRWAQDRDFFLVAEVEGCFAGYVYHKPETVEDLAAYMKLDPEYVRRVSDGKDVIHCRSAVLVQEYEHGRLMLTMVEKLEATAKKAGFGAEFAPAWKYEGRVPMRRILLSQGYTEICEKEMLWFDQKEYHCVVCHGPCTCTAVIFQKKL